MKNTLRKILDDARKENGGWLISEGQHRAVFGSDGLLAQRGIVGTKRVQDVLSSGIPSQMMDLVGFGLFSPQNMIGGMIKTYCREMHFEKCDGGFRALTEENENLAIIESEALKTQCIQEDPSFSLPQSRFCLYPVGKIRWDNDKLEVEVARSTCLPANARKPNLGQVWAYVVRSMRSKALLPRNILFPHLFPATNHRPDTMILPLIRPYEDAAILPIAVSSRISDPDKGEFDRHHLLEELYEQCGLDRDSLSYPEYDPDRVVMWTGAIIPITR